MSDFHKGSIVWYFDRYLKQWRKGKVLAVNKHSLVIKKRHNAYRGDIARYEGLVLNGAEPKPTLNPEDLLKKFRMENSLRYNYEPNGVTRLLLRMGIYK